jgi:hypothetical protein
MNKIGYNTKVNIIITIAAFLFAVWALYDGFGKDFDPENIILTDNK